MKDVVNRISCSFLKKILIIDDEREICRSLKGILTDEGYQVKTTSSPESAYALLEEEQPDLVLLDVWFGKSSWDGMHLLDMIHQNYPAIPVIMISGHATLTLAVRAIKKGAVDFVEKPIDVERLFLVVRQALEIAKLRSQHRSDQGLHKMILRPWPFELDAKLRKMAGNEGRILLVGEQGMRKARLAHKIHTISSRSEGPCLIVTAYALNQMEPEDLWGRDDATKGVRWGLLDKAQGGTLIVQNVHELSLDLQKQWAKIFQSNAMVRVGGTKAVALNVRILATAVPAFLHPESVKAYYPSFYDRMTLSLYTLRPLREDRRSIGAWADVLLEGMATDWGRPIPTLAPDALHALQQHAWPHNVRGLTHVLESALMATNSDMLTLADLPDVFHREGAGVHTDINHDIYTLPLKAARALFEFQYVRAQLAAADGNFTRAAEVIGMERSALHRKLKALQTAAQRAQKDAS